MKLLIAGAFNYPIYERAFLDAWRDLGLPAEEFDWSPVFSGVSGKVQQFIPVLGPAAVRLNSLLRQKVLSEHPDVVLIWRGIHVFPSTYHFIREKCHSIVVSYNNDDPFGPRAHGDVPWHHHFLWRWYLKSLPFADLTLVFRPVNVEEAREAGAKCVGVMLPYFIPGKDRPLVLGDDDEQAYGCDVVFAGHYENDGRDRHLAALVDAGLSVKLFGGDEWNSRLPSFYKEYFRLVRPAIGDDYIKALCGAKMCLCFLSRLNRDVYTRRCFEITSCGSLLLSERTKELTKIFREDEEAVYFSSSAELVEKATWLKSHPDEIARIAAAGLRRVHADEHSVHDRARQLLSLVKHVDARKGQIWNP
ncbi:CgeB family protein [Mesorhizobium tianshanense]|uniref:Glycosyl transferase family 1 n=1 Tax=Mesorhizobium tianshanense TaxID=39844 RepID=A0A562NRH5_9HYPH|nr:glycosyltransferase [Mesorhizobium tianshanense]TWI34804.1 glycosyl transferase family 1 [Mesorhizobium tianshanense]